MSKNSKILSSHSGSLDTLELTSEIYNENLALSQDGKVGFNLKKRAHSKALNTSLFGKLLFHNTNLHGQYQDVFYCSHSITADSEKAKSNFCKKRFCMICNRIRTAQLINTYIPTLDSWDKKVFLTLTVKNMSHENLNTDLQRMYKSFTLIKDRERKAGNKLVGLRKLECTYNRFTDEYHPHYHLILESPHRAETIISEWLRHFPNADRACQDVRPADKNSCHEMFKYFTKLSSNSSKDNIITLSALHNIFNSIQGVRTFQPFGFIAHKMEAPIIQESLKEISEENRNNYEYDTRLKDWVDKETGELLTNYFEPERLDNWEKKIAKGNLFEFNTDLIIESENQIILNTNNQITIFENESKTAKNIQ